MIKSKKITDYPDPTSVVTRVFENIDCLYYVITEHDIYPELPKIEEQGFIELMSFTSRLLSFSFSCEIKAIYSPNLKNFYYKDNTLFFNTTSLNDYFYYIGSFMLGQGKGMLEPRKDLDYELLDIAQWLTFTVFFEKFTKNREVYLRRLLVDYGFLEIVEERERKRLKGRIYNTYRRLYQPLNKIVYYSKRMEYFEKYINKFI